MSRHRLNTTMDIIRFSWMVMLAITAGLLLVIFLVGDVDPYIGPLLLDDAIGFAIGAVVVSAADAVLRLMIEMREEFAEASVQGAAPIGSHPYRTPAGMYSARVVLMCPPLCRFKLSRCGDDGRTGGPSCWSHSASCEETRG